MDNITKETLKSLFLKESQPCISVYFPTHKEWNGTDQDITRYRNTLRKIEKLLLEKNFRQSQVDELLKNPRSLLDNREFWNHQDEGLAVFIAKDEFHHFKLPLKVEELCIISHRYHLKPLLQLLNASGKFFLVTLDKNEVRFFKGSKYSLSQIPLPEGTPKSFKEAMKYEDDQNSYQNRSITGGSAGGAGTRGGTYHGQGQGFDETIHKQKLVEFFQMVNKGIFNIIKDENAPLVLAGVEYLIPLYLNANSYPHLIDGGIKINPEGLSPDELHKRAYELVKHLFEKAEDSSRAKYEQFSGGEKASSNIEEVVKAAYAKKIDSLFVDIQGHIWGHFDAANNEVEINGSSSTSEDLLNLAAVYTFLNGGRVFAVERDRMPNKGEVAAIFRY